MKYVNLFLVLGVLLSSCKKEVVNNQTSTPTPIPKVTDSTNLNNSNSNSEDTFRIYQLNWYSQGPDTIFKGRLNQGKSIPNIEFYIDFSYYRNGVIIPETSVECLTIPGISLKYKKIDTTTTSNNPYQTQSGKIYYSISGTPLKSGLAKFKINIKNQNGHSVFVNGNKTDTISFRINGYSEPITDIEGSSYKTVWIGTQLWMAENLKTTKYNDGTPIPLNQNALSGYSSLYPGYCYYNNDEKNKDIYGALYQWGVVEKQKVCPTGWRVPSDYDYYTLTGYLGNDDFLAEKLKEPLTWKNSAYFNATNSSLFSALAAGSRGEGFAELGISTGFWSSSRGKILNTTNPKAFTMYYNTGYFSGGVNNPDEYFFYVRCVKNQPNN